MRTWFKNLKEKNKKIVLFSLWGATVCLFLLFSAIGEQEQLKTIVSLFFAVCLVFSIIFSVWNSKIKQETKQNSNINNQEPSQQFTHNNTQDSTIQHSTYNSLDIKETFKIPDGKIVSYMRTPTTRVRGTYYNDIYEFEINIGDEIFVRHSPTNEYPEETEICLLSDGTFLGHLMQEMAVEYLDKFGEGFCFLGKIHDYETDDEDEPDKVTKIIVTFQIPSFKKK